MTIVITMSSRQPYEEELDRLHLAYSPRFRSILDASRQQIREGKGIPHEEFWQAVETDDEQEKASTTPGS
jgi:hypothetical protein